MVRNRITFDDIQIWTNRYTDEQWTDRIRADMDRQTEPILKDTLGDNGQSDGNTGRRRQTDGTNFKGHTNGEQTSK